jgi:predicted nucleic acid-binding protein
MDRLLVDTNVLLDVIGRRVPFYGDSVRIWELAERRQVEALVSAISFNNVYYIARRLANHKTAMAAVEKIRKIFGTAPVAEGTIDAALGSAVRDFEDAIQYACAKAAGARWLLSRNVSDYPRTGKPTAITPSGYLAKAKLG